MKSLLIAATVVTLSAPKPGPHPCLTEAQVEDLTLFALPPLLDATASKCAPHLPKDAYLLNGGRDLSRRLATEGAARWAGARSALSTVAEDKFPKELSETTARGLVQDLAASGMLGKAGPEECARIDRLGGLLSPLPPRNLAGIFVSIAGLLKDDKGKSPALICPAARP